VPAPFDAAGFPMPWQAKRDPVKSAIIRGKSDKITLNGEITDKVAVYSQKHDIIPEKPEFTYISWIFKKAKL
jgi:hypothetical protein